MQRLRLISWLGPVNAFSLATLGIGLLWLMYQAGLMAVWSESEEYGHGPLVLLVLGYLIYLRRPVLKFHATTRAIIISNFLPLVVFLLGASIGSPQLKMYSVWLFVLVTTATFGGIALLRQLAGPLLIAFMVIPLPYGAETALTAQLQLFSSQLGVWFIRLFGGVVHLQGNVIDMGGVKLLVAEACAGLRYLYPLMSLGALAGYVLRAPLWMRWTLFIATIPITVFMNSLRIGITGILAESWGLEHTEGFLHFFEGWVVFVFALIVLLLLAKLLLKLQPGAPRLLSALTLDIPAVHGNTTEARVPPYRGTLAAVAITALCAAILGPFLTEREELLPEHRPLSEFPIRIGNWNSNEYRLPPIVETVAGASEYYYSDYSSTDSGQVNLYISYYETQRQGQIPHSPRVCIPGDGWSIESHSPLTLRHKQGGLVQGNRLLIKKGDQTMLAYYWLKQGPNTYRHELLAKVDLIRSSLLHRRTDGALIRLVAELKPHETVADVDQRLTSFAEELTGVLPLFIPD